MAAPANPATPPPEPVALRFEPDGFVPNNRDLPVMLVPGALPGATAEEVKAKFPTNWELSTSRATNVVRYLQETGKIPGKRLVAAGCAPAMSCGSCWRPSW